MPGPMCISGRKITTGPSTTSLRFKAKLPRPLRSNCEQNFHPTKRPRSQSPPRTTSKPTISICAQKRLRQQAQIRSRLKKMCRKRCGFCRKRSVAIQSSCEPGLFYFEGNDHTPARLEQARAAVEEAQRLSPDAGETHLARAEYLYWGFRDYPGARAELAAAARRLPNDSEMFALSGYIDRRDGRWADATRNLEKAMELNPRDFRLLVQVSLLYQRLHRYSDAIAISERALRIVPGDPSTRMQRVFEEVDWRGDIQPYQKALGALLREDPSLGPEIEDPNYALCERTANAANRAIVNFPPEGIATNGTMFPKPYWQAVIERCQRSDAAARASFTEARQIVEKTVQEQPNHAIEHSLLGLIDAGLGRKDEAIREGRRACEILPTTKDAIDGTALEVNLAQIYAWTGEKDAAIAEIAEIQRGPNLLSYGLLKLSPVWDSLRGDPRFEKILASLAPKQ